MRKFIRFVLYILTSLLILLMILAGVFAYNKGYGKLTYFVGFTGFINTGTSMLPDIEPGDLLIVYRADVYNEQDVISFATGENFITTHRIIDKKDNSYITKGDNNSFVDSREVHDGQIYGKLVLIIPGAAGFVNFIWTYKYIIVGIFLIIPGVLMIISFKKGNKNVR